MIIPLSEKSLKEFNEILDYSLEADLSISDKAEILNIKRNIIKVNEKTISVSQKDAIFIELLIDNFRSSEHDIGKEIYDYIRRQYGLLELAVPIPSTGYPSACPKCGGELGKEENHRHEDCNGNPYGYKSKTCSKCFHSVTLPGSEW
jgi:hypothetical protein